MRVSRNSYYHWLKRKAHINPALVYLKHRIKFLFSANFEIYGSTKIQRMLSREGLNYSVPYIGYLMRQLGLKSILRRKFILTTNSQHDNPIAENLLNREFSSNQIGEKWVSDITYIRVANHWNYLTTIIDLADRNWIKARNTRQIKEGLIFHSDRGVQYTSNKIVFLLNLNTKITQSMSRKGNCWDNAVAESFFKTIKYEYLNRSRFTNSRQLYSGIDQYINWYNTKRIHAPLEYLNPLEKEIELTAKNHKNEA